MVEIQAEAERHNSSNNIGVNQKN